MSFAKFRSEFEDILAQQRLNSHFQPIVDINNGKQHGYEALLRGPADSILSTPDKLFAIAEGTGRTVELDLISSRTHIQRFGQLSLQSRLFINITPDALLNQRFDWRQFLDQIEAARLKPQQLVVEVTEHAPVGDYPALRAIIHAFRQSGIAIAIDDLGSGYSGLRQWSELHPEYVKIDAHFVRDVHKNATKRQFIHSIVEIGRTLGSRVIAEGIETEEEFETVQDLGVSFGQGYYLSRPAEQPPVVPAELFEGRRQSPKPLRTTQTVGSIVRTTPMVQSDRPVDEVADLFRQHTELRCLVVSKGRMPMGLLQRDQLLSLYASRYGRDLYGRRPVSEILVDCKHIIVSAQTTLDELSERITEEFEDLPEQDLIITDTDGGFMGTASFMDLLRAITQLQIRTARYANPLTQLPGNVPINERIDQLLMDGEGFHIAYCDLDNFKPFNDSYGYASGDDILRNLGRILQEEVGNTNFVGHVGGDDFILILQSEDWETRCRNILQQFEREVPRHYRPEHQTIKGLYAKDRRGHMGFYPFLSLSIGVIHAEPFSFSSHKEIATLASGVKQQAKLIRGNSLFVDRRGQIEDDMAELDLASLQED